MFLFLFQILRFAQDDTDGLRMTSGPDQILRFAQDDTGGLRMTLTGSG